MKHTLDQVRMHWQYFFTYQLANRKPSLPKSWLAYVLGLSQLPHDHHEEQNHQEWTAQWRTFLYFYPLFLHSFQHQPIFSPSLPGGHVPHQDRGHLHSGPPSTAIHTLKSLENKRPFCCNLHWAVKITVCHLTVNNHNAQDLNSVE